MGNRLSASTKNDLVKASLLGVQVGLAYVLYKAMTRAMNPNQEGVQAAKAVQQRMEARLQEAGVTDLNFDSYERLAMSLLIHPDDIDVGFADVGGLEEQIAALTEISVLPMRRPDLFARSKLTAPPSGVLLYGPPGVGKTMLAKAVAKESGAFFLNVSPSYLLNKYYGESQKLLKGVFTLDDTTEWRK